VSPQADETQEILQRLTRVETKLDMMVSARDIAFEALQSTKQAHKRLDKIDKWLSWIGTTVIGGVILAILGFMINGGFKIK
jgi:tetrahydromethanopterin S-methyltransferase subunit G